MGADTVTSSVYLDTIKISAPSPHLARLALPYKIIESPGNSSIPLILLPPVLPHPNKRTRWPLSIEPLPQPRSTVSFLDRASLVYAKHRGRGPQNETAVFGRGMGGFVTSRWAAPI
jgi:hypothetical protein